MKHVLQSKVALFAIGLMASSTTLCAATINWQPVTAVPLDRTSMIVMAILFVLIGSWFMSKTRKPMQQFLLAAVLTTGVYQYSSQAVVVITEMQGASQLSFNCGEARLIHNNMLSPAQALQVTGDAGQDCAFGHGYAAPQLRDGYSECGYTQGDSNYAQTMQSDEYCYVYTYPTNQNPS